VISAPWFELDGKYLRKGPTGELVAEHENFNWRVEGIYCFSVTFLSRTCVHYGEQADGSFHRLRLADGYIHADGRLYAKLLSDSRHWQSYERGQLWSVLTIKPPLSDDVSGREVMTTA
jgi:hypothetical protein